MGLRYQSYYFLRFLNNELVKRHSPMVSAIRTTTTDANANINPVIMIRLPLAIYENLLFYHPQLTSMKN
mgnify:FL=1